MLGIVLLIAGALIKRLLGVTTAMTAAYGDDRPTSQSIVRRSLPRSTEWMSSHGDSSEFREPLVELSPGEIRHQRGKHKKAPRRSRTAELQSAGLAEVASAPDSVMDYARIGLDGRSRSVGSPLLDATSLLDNTTASTRAFSPTDLVPQSLMEGSKYAVLKGFDDEDCNTAIGEFEFISKANFYAADNCYSIRKNGNAYGKTSWYCDNDGQLVIHFYKAQGDGSSSCSGDEKRQLTLEAFKLDKFTHGECVAALNLETRRVQYVSIHNRHRITWPSCARGFTRYLALACFTLFISFLIIVWLIRYRIRLAKRNTGAQQGAPS